MTALGRRRIAKARARTLRKLTTPIISNRLCFEPGTLFRAGRTYVVPEERQPRRPFWHPLLGRLP